jgi:nucleotide-binding universal stress UspA family protein
MVYLELEEGSEPALRVACELADRFKSGVIGITAGLAAVPIHADGMIASSVLEIDYRHLNQAIDRCEARLRSALKGSGCALEWRSNAAYPADYLAAEACAADLVVVGRSENYAPLGPAPQLDIGDAVMKAGRPVLVVPPRCTSLSLDRVLVAWKDTAESRRAISAALPLLRKATATTIVDVAHWLRRHHVQASAQVELSAGDAGSQLDAIASEARIDIIVAGAYGHARLSEWIFGGVTRHLLQRSSACVLLVH